ncbi:MAG: glutamine synthetase family protein [Lachnospiraceae bacterium]|nr:glutamine synthetase family protein [Lachnospiraceae bacterium]
MSYTIEEALEFVEENDVKFIRLAFCDIFGNHKNISIMPYELEQALYEGIAFDYCDVDGYEGGEAGDLFLKPDPSTLSVLPWRPQQGCVIRFYCDVVLSNGESYMYGARKLLKDTIAECKKEGFSCRIGLKSEFYLFKTDEEGNPTNIPWDNGAYLDVAPLDRGENIRREICLCLEEMGIQPQASYHEAGPGQNEIDFKAADALKSADNFITYKNVVSNIAARNGVCASFAAKPLKGKSGNGLHLYITLNRGGVDISEEHPEIYEGFLAGILNRMRDITVFLNSQEESYQRFGENEAPKFITWSKQNSSRLLRVVENRGKQVAFVLRSPDSSINPYLAFSFVMQAGLEGVRNKETLPPAQERNIRHDFNEMEGAYDTLPLSLEEAISCARNSEFVQADSRKEIADIFIRKLLED